MTRVSLTRTAHELIETILRPGDRAIDATVGNGHDTLFLARCVGDSGRVFGFDIQSRALRKTADKLAQQGMTARTALFNVDHSQMGRTIPADSHGKIKVAMFNLGYLPGGDKTITTQTANTVKAIAVAAEMTSAHGLISILAYPGHPEGALETGAVEHYLYSLPAQDYQVRTLASQHPTPSAPRLFVVEKKPMER